MTLTELFIMLNVIIYVQNAIKNANTTNQIVNNDGELPKHMVKGLQNILNHMKMDVQLSGAKLKISNNTVCLCMDNLGKVLPEVIIVDGRG